MSTSLKSNRGIEDAFPPHLVPKWKREVEMTVHGARAVVKSITDLERLRLSIGSGPLFAVMSREKAKLSLPLDARRHRAVGRLQAQAGAGRGDGRAVPGALLPRLHRSDRGQGRVPLTDEDLNRRKHTCAGCGSPPLAGGQVRPRPLPSGRLREAPDEGLLRPAGRGRGARVCAA